MSPVLIKRFNNKKPWGTFAVINSDVTSTINYLVVDGGSGDKINGIPITGMFAFHNSDVEITSSTFINSGDDDALNIKMSAGKVENCLFQDNFSDAFDLDFAQGFFEIKNNNFEDNGGDSVDLSFSKVLIKDNEIVSSFDKGISAVSYTHLTLPTN